MRSRDSREWQTPPEGFCFRRRGHRAGGGGRLAVLAALMVGLRLSGPPAAAADAAPVPVPVPATPEVRPAQPGRPTTPPAPAAAADDAAAGEQAATPQRQSALTGQPALAPAALTAAVEAQVAALGDDDLATRNAATQALIELGPAAAPVLERHAKDGDLEVKRRVQMALERLQRAYGPARGGLRLAALPVGAAPQRGDCVRLKVTLFNTSKEARYLPPDGWNLRVLKPELEAPPARALLPARDMSLGGEDWICIPPGGHFRLELDADLAHPRGDPATPWVVEVRLDLGRAAVDEVETEAVWHSRPLTIEFDPAPTELSPAAFRFGEAVTQGRWDPDQAVQAEKLTKSTPPGDRRQAVKSYLRAPSGEERRTMFWYACVKPDPALAQAVLDYADYSAPPYDRDQTLAPWLLHFAICLPSAERKDFVARCVALCFRGPTRWYGNSAGKWMESGEVSERAVCALWTRALHDRGMRDGNTDEWLAWELAFSPDPAVRDADRAREIAADLLKAAPEDMRVLALNAVLTGQPDSLRSLLADANVHMVNSAAWRLAIHLPCGDARLATGLEALRAALQRLEGEQGEFHAEDTCAALAAGTGNYAEALRWEELALKHMPENYRGRAAYAHRLVQFVALAQGEADEAPAYPLGDGKLHSAGARAALLARLKVETDAGIAAELRRVLTQYFPDEKLPAEAPPVPPSR